MNRKLSQVIQRKKSVFGNGRNLAHAQTKMVISILTTNAAVNNNMQTIAFRYGDQKYACAVDENCPMRFSDTETQSRHHAEIHFSKKPFVCPACYEGKRNVTLIAFETLKDLRKHERKVHEKDKK